MFKTDSNTRTWLVVVPILTLAGCTPHKLYRVDTEVCVSSQPDVECQESALQEYDDAAHPDTGYLLAFIEFDDQGQLHNRKQMQAVIDELNKDAARQDLLMVWWSSESLLPCLHGN